MHFKVDDARKSAGIGGMRKNYPDDPKQRGCGYWAAFCGALSQTLENDDREKLRVAEERRAETADWAKMEQGLHEEIRKHLAEIERLRKKLQTNGIEVLRYQEGWSIEKGQEAQKTIAG